MLVSPLCGRMPFLRFSPVPMPRRPSTGRYMRRLYYRGRENTSGTASEHCMLQIRPDNLLGNAKDMDMVVHVAALAVSTCYTILIQGMLLASGQRTYTFSQSRMWLPVLASPCRCKIGKNQPATFLIGTYEECCHPHLAFLLVSAFHVPSSDRTKEPWT